MKTRESLMACDFKEAPDCVIPACTNWPVIIVMTNTLFIAY